MSIKPTTINFKQPETQEEYMDMVARVSWLVDFDLRNLEKLMEEGKIHDLANRLPRTAINVLVIRNFREGFIDAFPKRTGIQKDLYANQDHFESRVYRLVEFVGTSERAKESYTYQLKVLLGGLTFEKQV